MTSELSDPSDLGIPDAPPYIELDQGQRSALALSAPLPLTQADVERLRRLGDPIGLAEVGTVYRSLTALLEDYIATSRERAHRANALLGVSEPPMPFIVAVAGSVAMSKSTTVRLIAHLLGRFPGTPRVGLVTTDDFPLPNRVLEGRELMTRRGSSEFYDRRALLELVAAVKSGSERVQVPVYSHTVYDIVPDRHVAVERPDILVLRRPNVFQPAPRGSQPGASALAMSDFIDFSIYVDADPGNIRRWYPDRFLTLKHTAFVQPGSCFRRFVKIPDDMALAGANEIWESVNLISLHGSIAPTRGRVALVLTEDAGRRMSRVLLHKS